MIKIAITGTPGTGKTTIAKELSNLLGIPLVNTSDLLKKSSVGFDKKRNCLIIDEIKFGKLISKIEGDFIIEGLLVHNISSKFVTNVIVLTCNHNELKKRLIKKGWKKEKIQENLDAENMKVILGETKDLKHNVIEFDTSGKTPKKSAENLKRVIMCQQ